MVQLIHKLVVVPDEAEVYFVGDIHGCYDLLMNTLKAADFNFDRDYCICVGDLIDRGKDNLKVLSKFAYGENRFYSVMGNHDAFMAYSSLDNVFANWMYNGGSWAISKDGLDSDQISTIAEDLRKKLPVFLTVKHRGRTYGVVHGGIPNVFNTHTGVVEPQFSPNTTRDWFRVVSQVEAYTNDKSMTLKEVDFLISPYLWDRDVLMGFEEGENYPPVTGVDYTFHGHTGVKFPVKHQNRVFIDTGSVFNNRLTVAWVSGGGINYVTSNPNDIPFDRGTINV